MKKLIMLMIAIVLCSNMYAQNNAGEFTIRGIVVDSLTNEEVPFATLNIALVQAPTRSVKMFAGDLDGKFVTQLPAPGDYVMSVQAVGMGNTEKRFTLSENKDVNLGTIYMTPRAEVMKELTVTAQKTLVRVEIDKIIYDMEEDPEAKVSTALEMLRKVPMVTVDGEDKIQLKGSSNFKIYLNGKPSNMLSGQNVSTVLKGMPANSIKNIEVITDPGARYDAEGIGGIINIVTSRNVLQGYTGSVGANASTFGAVGGYGYLTAKIGKIGLTGNYNINQFRTPGGSSEYDYENKINDDYYLQKSFGDNKYNGLFQMGNFEISYEIDTLNLLSIGGNLYGGGGDNKSNQKVEMFSRAGNPMYSYNRKTDNDMDYGSKGLNVDYQRSTSKKDEFLTFSYRFNDSPDDMESYTYMTDIQGDVPAYLRAAQWVNNDATTREHTGQIDYTNPITPKHVIEVGAKYILRQSMSHVKRHFNEDGTTWVLQPENDNDNFKQSNHIYSAYAGYTYKTNTLSFKGGLRGEGTSLDAKYKNNNTMNFDANYFNLVPSLSVSYRIGMTKQLRFGYNLRISRPHIWYLNPYINDTDPLNISYGNPDLDVEKGHNINSNFSYFSQKLSINASASYNHIDNSIESYSFINPETPNIKETTYNNMGKNQRVNGYLNVTWTPVKLLRLSLNGGLGYTNIESKSLNLSNDGVTGNISGFAQLTFPKDFRVTLNGMYYSGWISLQGKSSSQYFTAISVNKDFLDKKLNVGVSLSSPFEKYMSYKNTSESEFFKIKSSSKMQRREVRFSVSYRFGTLKEQIKKVQRGISNDDVKGGGGGGGGGESGGGGGGAYNAKFV